MSKRKIWEFTLPRYNEIPNVGLYLKQVVKLISEAVEPCFGLKVSDTMLSNYVKMHIVSGPVKKMYYRDQIASLMFVVLAKSVLSLDNIQTIITCTGLDEFIENRFKINKVFQVTEGTVSEKMV